MSNLSIPSREWLKEQFEYECCDECGGGTEDHDAVPLLGNWFARCKKERAEEPAENETVISS